MLAHDVRERACLLTGRDLLAGPLVAYFATASSCEASPNTICSCLMLSRTVERASTAM